jgi:hypothetical protein
MARHSEIRLNFGQKGESYAVGGLAPFRCAFSQLAMSCWSAPYKTKASFRTAERLRRKSAIRDSCCALELDLWNYDNCAAAWLALLLADSLVVGFRQRRDVLNEQLAVIRIVQNSARVEADEQRETVKL